MNGYDAGRSFIANMLMRSLLTAHELLRQTALAVGLAGSLALVGRQLDAAELPVPCGGASCAGGPAVWVTQGVATSVTNAAGTRMDITQTTDKAVLNWAEFNVGEGNQVNFIQPGRSSLALNRIFQGDPSRIFGTITANGQIYLINQNGILFGKDSQVNVGALLASSLDIEPDALSDGILNPTLLRQGRAAFQGDGRVFVVDADGQVVSDANGNPIPVKIVVEEGARIASAEDGGGSVLLLGQDVENAGQIDSASGQVILAAGQKVYLQASESADLRGLLVEVDAGGTAWNQATGQIASTQGNVTLVGLAVNQDGRVSATTSVQSNGSVRLLARDSVSVVDAGQLQMRTGRAGAVSFGEGSTTEVLADAATADRTAVSDQLQPVSAVEVVGRQIEMSAGSTIRVPGGSVSMTALPNPSITGPVGDTPLPEDEESRIRLEAGSLIDVSGSTAEVDLARNVVAVELRANELRDSPVQRDGALRGATVYVDSRVGTPLADVSGAAAQVSRDVHERTSTGGTVTLNSRGDVVLAEGATIDVSGGTVNYRGGVLETSRVVTADGKALDISRADPDRLYQGVSNPTMDVVHRKWGVIETRTSSAIGLYQSGYVEGRDAGSVEIAAPRLVLNGNLLGNAYASSLQRTPARQPLGGRLVIGLPGGSGLDLPDYRAPSVNFTNDLVPVTVSPGEALPGSWQHLELPTRYLTDGGFTRTAIYSNGVISIGPDVDLDLAAGSSLRLQGAVVDVQGNIRSPGGDVLLGATPVHPFASAAGERRPGVYVADGVGIDVSGRWVNDQPQVAGLAPADPVFVDGGRIDMQVTADGGELSIGNSVELRADGGAWLQGNGKLTGGRGGEIGLRAGGPQAALATGDDLRLSASGMAAGGTLTLAANHLRVVEAPVDGSGSGGNPFAEAQRADPTEDDRPYEITSDTFRSGGFGQFNLIATGGRSAGDDGEAVEPLTIAAGAMIAPQVVLRVLDAGFAGVASGADIRAFSSLIVPLDDVRPAAGVSFAVQPHRLVTSATAGDLHMEAGSTVRVDPRGRVEFSAPTRVRLDGTVIAPAGDIVARIGNPGSALENGFDAGVGIFVGATARLDARGTVVPVPNDLGLRLGEVLDGGRIDLSAQRGRVELAAGAELDVSGTAATLDLPTGSGVSGSAVTRPATVASRGGTIELLAPEGLVVDATLRGAGGSMTPGSAAAGGARAEGGTLAIGVSRLRGFSVATDLLPTFPTGERRIVVTDGSIDEQGGIAANGVAEISTARVTGGGFDSLTLQADGEILFATDTDLAFANRLSLQAPNLRAADGVDAVSLSAAYLALGPRLNASAAPAGATYGDATLSAQAGLIDLFGRLSLQGFGDTRLAAATDIRATGLPVSSGASMPGAFNAAGRLELNAAQVYPTTFSDYAIDVTGGAGAPGLLEILGNGSQPGRVLSAMGRLDFAADEIVQSGTVRAPLGQIGFDAADRLTLAEGSTTSVSADGELLPFGRIAGGTSWTYEAITGVTPDITAPLEKRILLDGDEIVVAEGAVVDLSGGGDLYSYEFLPGPGGSVDALAPGVRPNLYAVIPGLGPYAPYDAQEYAGSGLLPGDSVRLEAIPGLLEAGEYALLPARYALLPGALLVEALPSVRDPGTRVNNLRDGTPVVAGVRTIAGTGIADSRTTGFAVRPGSHARNLAEYQDSYGNSFFDSKAAALDRVAPPLARDAGALQLVVGSLLDLNGDLRLRPDEGDPKTADDDGRGGRLDLSALHLRIVESFGDEMGDAASGVVEVTADVLNRIGVDSILLGGTRSAQADHTLVTPVAQTVEIADGLQVSGSEYLLLAKEQVRIGVDAALRSTGSATREPGGRLVVAGSGGSALVGVSRAGAFEVERGPGAAQAGDVFIGEGAVLGAGGSITLDAAGVARSFGDYELGADTTLALGSGRIVLGAAQSGIADGLALDAAALASFGAAAELRFTARDGLDVAGPVVLGSVADRPERLLIDTPVIRGSGSDASFRSGELTIRNSGDASAAEPTGGSGVLAFDAGRVLFAEGDVALDGFDAAHIGATVAANASGSARLHSGADLTISTPSLGGAAGSEFGITAPGRAVELTRAGAPVAEAAAPVGAALHVDAGSIVADTALLYPAGRVRLVADGDVSLGDGGRIDVSGRRLDFAGVEADVAAGAVEIVARNGDVDFAAGSRVDVSTGSGTAGAGSLGILAGGEARFAGELAGTGPSSGSSSGSSADSSKSGTFALTANTLASFSGLNGRLNEGGFFRSRSIETLEGDLTVGAGDVVRADEVTLAASGGSLTVAGRIDAAAPGGGRVVLAARDDLTLGAGAEIDARSSADGTDAAAITLASVDGEVNLEAGSRLRLDGPGAPADGMAAGELLIRAGATGDDVRVSGFAATIEGAVRIIIEPVLRSEPLEYLGSFVTESLRSMLDGFMAIAPETIRTRLGLDAEAAVIRPGLEVISAGDLLLGEDWNLADWRWDGQPGYLTLRAAGNLNVEANLSDGFVQAGTVLGQLAGDSWSYRLVAGADLGSALPFAVTGRLLDAPGAGTLEIGDGVLVRTGTGSIDLLAADDLVLSGATTAVYTAGVAARQAVNIGLFRANWSRDGGDIRLAAGRDIVATLPAQVLSGWNVRNSFGGRAQWAIDYGRFRQGIAALAGGEVKISAGRDIHNLSATVATTGGDPLTEPGAHETWGGGSLDVSAGRDVLGGTWSIWQGDGSIIAGRSVGLGTTADFFELGATLAAGAGTLAVTARRDLDVGGIVNPTVIPSVNPSSTYFYTYRPDDALHLTAVGGRLRLLNDLDAFGMNVGGDFASLLEAFSVAPPTLRALAASGNLELVRELRMLPAPRGQLAMIAAGSILAGDRGVPLIMSDASPAAVPTFARPVGAVDLRVPVSKTSDAVIHADDADPALLIAANGDIVGGAWQFSKHFHAVAGGDIRDLSLSGQNTDASRISLVQAGRDVDLNSRDNPANSSGNQIEVAGPGRLQVIAGRHVGLGFSRGITTLGNTANAQLPAGGAALDVWAGLGSEPDYAAFVTGYWQEQYSDEMQRYVGDAGLLEYVARATGRDDLTPDTVWSAWAGLEDEARDAFVATLAPDLRITFGSFAKLVDAVVAWTNVVTGRTDLTPTTAVAELIELGLDEQRPMIQEFFFRELRDSGRLANLPRDNFGFDRGQAAIETLFPDAEEYDGDISLLFSRLYTLSGGDISLLAPGGLLNVGLAMLPPNLPVTKQPSQLGIVAQGTGRVLVFADGDVLVNQSRVFTLAGGDIVIWSSNGDIDAGRGSKSSVSAPPPVIRVDADGQVEVEFSDAIAGSGIRGILTREDLEPGDVDLIAPTGQVNAGDAGIGTAGDLNIAAPQVVGLDNIQVAGVASGVPADTGVAAGLTGVSSLSSSVSSAAGAAAVAGATGSGEEESLASQALGWLDVFIEGFGEDDEDDDEEGG